jgi:hypothetical protein
MDVKHFSKTLAKVASSDGSETTPAAITSDIITFCESLKTNPPIYVSVQNDANGMYGVCNLSVLEKIKIDGGTIRFGWTIWEYPGLFITGEFHAVWADPTGMLIDITPKPDGEQCIVFADDPTYPPDFDFRNRPRNHRKRLYQPVDRAKLARDRIATFSESQLRYETKRATLKNMTLDQWVESRVAVDPLPDLIDGFIRDADAMESLYKFHPSGVGTYCCNTSRLEQLARNKQQKLREIEKLIRRSAV